MRKKPLSKLDVYLLLIGLFTIIVVNYFNLLTKTV